VKNIQNISIDDFDYPLTENHIAKYPLANRSDSQLLYYHEGKIEHKKFKDIIDLFSPGDLWVVNNTKVIPARIHFQKNTGAQIEVFCLEPLGMDYTTALTAKTNNQWLCFVGGAKKWKEGTLSKPYSLNGEDGVVEVTCLEKREDGFIIDWKWSVGQFSEMLDACGELPIPPYLNRDTEPEDYERYQTLFAKLAGSVAAPTASLHFDESIIQKIQEKNVQQATLTLHVGAGTFKPVSAAQIGGHEMHAEYFEVSLPFMAGWIEKLKNNQRTIVVGTTALRTLETLYWLGNQKCQPDTQQLFHLGQWVPYENQPENSLLENIEWLYQKATSMGLSSIAGTTQIIIGPGYEIKSADALVTNFHQPKSTLLLLVHAVVGEDWKKIYHEALNYPYRFLSYGDSSWLQTKKASH
jgi:S-adenosylmethionine:tRNA ribosyltransferase-isomerase